MTGAKLNNLSIVAFRIFILLLSWCAILSAQQSVFHSEYITLIDDLSGRYTTINVQENQDIHIETSKLPAIPPFQIAIGDSANNWGHVTSVSNKEIIFTGHTYESEDEIRDIHVFMTDASGGIIWSKAFGGSKDDWPVHSMLGDDSSITVMGQTASYGAGRLDFFFTQIDMRGNLRLFRTYGTTEDDFCNGASHLADGGYVIAGGTRTSTQGSADISVMKIDSAGTLIWSRCFGGYNYESVYSVQETPQGEILLFGYSNTWTAIGADLFVLKLDANGETIWLKLYEGPAEILAGQKASYICDNGQILIAGYGDKSGFGGWDFIVIKLDQEGAVLWSKTLGGEGDDKCRAIIETSNGNILVVGSTTSFGAEDCDSYAVMLNGNGALIWSKCYGGNQSDAFLSVTESELGRYYMSGYTESFGVDGKNQYCVQIDGKVGSNCFVKDVETTSIDVEFSVNEIFPIRSIIQQGVRTTLVKSLPTHNTKLQLETICIKSFEAQSIRSKAY